MISSRTLSTCLICLFIVACDGQEPTETIDKITDIKTAPEKTAQQKPRQALNLSIDNIAIDNHGNDDDIFDLAKDSAEIRSDTFETLSRDQTKPDIDLSGKLLTDEEKIDNKEYLDSIDGLRINIEGSFQ